jgi:hypothetical protein
LRQEKQESQLPGHQLALMLSRLDDIVVGGEDMNAWDGCKIAVIRDNLNHAGFGNGFEKE